MTMKAEYLYRVVHCSERKDRVFRIEIAISPTAAMVINAEAMPPGYDIALDRMRAADERVHRFEMDACFSSDYPGCPFCGNKATFRCSCGSVSCIKRDHNGHHCCPVCGDIAAVRTERGFDASDSGFLNGPHRTHITGRYEPPMKTMPVETVRQLPRRSDWSFLEAPKKKRETQRLLPGPESKKPALDFRKYFKKIIKDDDDEDA